ncbi:MAG: ABC transporter substrate-binding protein [Acidobacteriota bacterium]
MTIRLPKPTASTKILACCLLWLGLIGALHYQLNSEPKQQAKVIMGYMPVITNLAAPIVDAASQDDDVRFQAMKFSTFSEMGEAFRAGHIQAAFIIAPLAVALHRQGVPLKVVYIGNRHESTLVVRKDLNCSSFACLVGKTIAVPIRFSGHHLALKKALRDRGMDSQSIKIVEIPPPDMPSALLSGGIDGYFVGEPFAAKSIEAGSAVKLLHVEDIWPEFICNLMIVRDDLIQDHPEWVEKLVASAAGSGIWAREHMDDAITLACRYWGQDPKVVRYAFNNPPGRVRFDLFTPKVEEMALIAKEMKLTGLIDDIPDIRTMVDDRFARRIDPNSSSTMAIKVPK